jgi:hypothetical protein
LIQAFRQYGGSKGAAMATVREKIDDEGSANLLNLYSGKITWGEYNQNRKDINIRGRDKQNEIFSSK